MTTLNNKINSDLNEKIEFWKNEYTCTKEQALIYENHLNSLYQEMLKKKKEGKKLENSVFSNYFKEQVLINSKILQEKENNKNLYFGNNLVINNYFKK
jgi:hypothetical protein